MTKTRVLSAAVVVGALALAPMSSAVAGGGHWSHGPSRHGGYWYGGVWWPVAAAAAAVGTAAALVAAPFVAIGNAVAYAAYVVPQSPGPYYAPQQYYAPQEYNAPQQGPAPYYAPQQYYAPQGYIAPQQSYARSYRSAPQYDSSVPPDYYAHQAPQQYDSSAQRAPTYAVPTQGYYVPPRAYYPPVNTIYYRQRAPAPVSYVYYYGR